MQSSRDLLINVNSGSGKGGGLDAKTLIIGLDALSFSLARRLCQDGIWSNLKPIVESGNCLGISSELPEVSPVNWTSFFTASGPEQHGVYGFTYIDPETYRLGITDFSCVRAETVWDRLGSAGQSSKIINLPCTYPAPSLKGMLISGFLAPDLEKSVYPGALYPILSESGYKLEADTRQGLSNPEALLRELHQTIASRIKALDMFWPDMAWDMFILVFTELDRLGHFLFDALTDERHRLHRECMELLRALDRAVGETLDRFREIPEPKRLMVVADHGFGLLQTEVDVNALLRFGGFLELKRAPANELDVSCLDESSRALALDPGRIYIHDRDRFARGRVNNLERASIVREIKSLLEGLTYQGQKVMERVYWKEEIYPDGKGFPPDLLCVPRPGFDLKAKFDRREVFGHFGRTGTHRPEDVFFYDSAGARPGSVREILDGILYQ